MQETDIDFNSIMDSLSTATTSMLFNSPQLHVYLHLPTVLLVADNEINLKVRADLPSKGVTKLTFLQLPIMYMRKLNTHFKLQ